MVWLEKTNYSQVDTQIAIMQQVLPLLTSKNIIIQLYEKPVAQASYVDMIYRTYYWRPLIIEDINTYTGTLYWYGNTFSGIHILNNTAYNSKVQPHLWIKVENGIITDIDGLGGGSAQYQTNTEIDLLTKNYNKSWTPTQDYNPVHKKYVDDAIASIDIPETDLTDYATIQYVDDLLANTNGLIDIEETTIDSDTFHSMKTGDVYRIVNSNTRIYYNGTLSISTNYANALFIGSTFPLVIDGNLVTCLVGSSKYVFNMTKIIDADTVLTKTNTTSFTPTGDYNPATKKYVDEAVAGVSGGSGGGADLTNYYTKAEVDALLQELRNEFVSANNNINDKLETIIYGGE